MFCPVCRDEFEPGIATCPDHGAVLVPEVTDVATAPRADALLGRFHPDVADVLLALLRRRGIAHEVLHLGDTPVTTGPGELGLDADPVRAPATSADGVEIVVDEEHRDDLRAELVVNWQELVSGLPEERMYAVLREGGNLPGWRNAPTSSWVDREGRLQVSFDEEDAEADAGRVLGPALALLGVFLILIGWYAGANWETLAYVLGGTALVSGLIVPR